MGRFWLLFNGCHVYAVLQRKNPIKLIFDNVSSNAVFVFSGSHVVIRLVENYPEYLVVNLDKVLNSVLTAETNNILMTLAVFGRMHVEHYFVAN